MISKYDDHGVALTYDGVSSQIQAILLNLINGVDVQVTQHQSITYKELNLLFSKVLDQTELASITYNPIGKPIPFFVPHTIHSHKDSEQNVLQHIAPITVQEIEQQNPFPEDEEPVRSSDSEGPMDPKPTPNHPETAQQQPQNEKWGAEDSDEEVKEEAAVEPAEGENWQEEAYEQEQLADTEVQENQTGITKEKSGFRGGSGYRRGHRGGYRRGGYKRYNQRGGPRGGYYNKESKDYKYTNRPHRPEPEQDADTQGDGWNLVKTKTYKKTFRGGNKRAHEGKELHNQPQQ